ncbi:MAG: septal ring lytic transglycosylase RlpA family protein, partial [Aquabacterium sp.]
MSGLSPKGEYRSASALLLAAALSLLLVACGSAPRAPAPPPARSQGLPPAEVSRLPPGNAERDGPDAVPPPDLHLTPDAIPRIEPLRLGGPNKPYEVAGERYAPLAADLPVIERGLASWYGRKFHGRPTSNGEAYDMYAMTAAHKTMPLPSYARVRNPANGREIVVRVNDRGPFAPGRIIDLSYTAALRLGVLGGVAPVEVERLTHEAIRTGAWQRGVGGLATAQAPQPQAGSADDPIALIARREAQREAALAASTPLGSPATTP